MLLKSFSESVLWFCSYGPGLWTHYGLCVSNIMIDECIDIDFIYRFCVIWARINHFQVRLMVLSHTQKKKKKKKKNNRLQGSQDLNFVEVFWWGKNQNGDCNVKFLDFNFGKCSDVPAFKIRVLNFELEMMDISNRHS